jgi:3-oxoadipate enol-lactonase
MAEWMFLEGHMPDLDLRDVRIRYQFDGPENGPLLVLSNSLGTSFHMWDRVMPALTKHYRVLRYDTRGQGASSVPPGPYTIKLLASDLLSLLDVLSIEHCFFCGLSLGGMTGIWLGIHAQARMQKLILANTAARISAGSGWNERMERVQKAGVDSIADNILDRWFTPAFRQEWPGQVETMRTMLASSPAQGYVGCCAAIRDEDLTPDLHLIRSPTLVIAAEFDLATPPTESRILQQGIAGAGYVELSTAHLSAIERPDEFSNVVLSFLQSQEL